MRIAALIVGIFGAMAGFVGAIVALAVGGIGAAFGEGTDVAWLGFGALVMSVAAWWEQPCPLLNLGLLLF